MEECKSSEEFPMAKVGTICQKLQYNENVGLYPIKYISLELILV